MSKPQHLAPPLVTLIKHEAEDEDSNDDNKRMETKVTIETPRLLLRASSKSDVDDLHECFSDAVAMRYWSTVPHPDLETTAAWIEKMHSPRDGVMDFVIELKSSPLSKNVRIDPSDRRPCIGKVGLWDGNEIGFIIVPKYWGLGLAHEAVTAVLDYVFAVFESMPEEVVETLVSDQPATEENPKSFLNNVIADVDPRNDLSLKALHRLGFEVYQRKEKTLKVGDTWVDSVYLSLNRDVWTARRLEGRASTS